jgi:5-formyltetrahydrofolate cyclo-ligase
LILDDPADKAALRRRARVLRRALPVDDRRRAEYAIAGHLRERALRADWRRVAGYAASASEADLSPWFDTVGGDLRLALPAIDADGVLAFRAWQPGDPLVPGPFSISQPAAAAPTLDPAQFDVVLLPLLGFDERGVRLGSGAGYYDRAFAFRRRQAPPPRLVGIAFETQRFERLPRDPWDVTLDAVVTESGWFDAATRAARRP